MHTVWVGKSVDRNLKAMLRLALHHLLVDVIPVVLLLAAMAYGMALVSHQLTEPRSVELKSAADTLG